MTKAQPDNSLSQDAPYIEVRPAKGKGRGVYATRIIPAGAELEVAAGLFFDAAQSLQLKETATFDHLLANPANYKPGAATNTYALILGKMSCCNHDLNNNAVIEWEFLPDGLWLTLRSLRAIPKGGEVTIKYTNLEEYPDGDNFKP